MGSGKLCQKRENGVQELAKLVLMPILLIWLIGSVSVLVFVGVAKRIVSIVWRQVPDAERFAQPKVALVGAFLGDIFGYFRYLRGGWTRTLFTDSQRLGSTVFGTNVGTPVVACLDRASAEVLFKDVTNSDFAHKINLRSTRASLPIFTTKGPNAVNARKLITALLPPDSDHPQYINALGAIKFNLRSWAEFSAVDLENLQMETAIGKLIQDYASTLFLGEPLDSGAIAKVFPFPNFLPKYPFTPAWMLPQFHTMNATLPHIFAQMKSSRRWDAVLDASNRVGLSPDEACENLFTVLTFNAAGLSNPMLNALVLVPLLPDKGNELLQDEALLDSFAWELLRHNGIPLMLHLKDDTTVRSSDGSAHRVRAGTTLMTNTAMAQRDPLVWSDPHVFKADRFVPLPLRSLSDPVAGDKTEPLPTLGFGCPIGHIDDEAQYLHSHQCPFVRLAQPLIKDYLRLLVSEFEWQIDPSSRAEALKLAGGKVLDVDFAPSNLRGGSKATEDMVLNLKGGLRFAKFAARSRV